MTQAESLSLYWKDIKIIVETDNVTTQTARKFYKHIQREFNECQHAQSDEEYINAEKRLDVIRDVMKRYNKSLVSKSKRTVGR